MHTRPVYYAGGSFDVNTYCNNETINIWFCHVTPDMHSLPFPWPKKEEAFGLALFLATRL